MATLLANILVRVGFWLVNWQECRFIQRYHDGMVGLPEYARHYDSLGIRQILMTASSLFVLLITAAALIAWLWRARVNAESHCAARHRLTRTWVIGSWFTPVVCLWFPMLIIDDVVRASDPRTQAGSQRLPASPTTPLVITWWSTLIAAVVVLWAGGRYQANADEWSDPGQAWVSLTWRAADSLLFSAAAICLIVIVIRVSRWQTDAARIEPQFRKPSPPHYVLDSTDPRQRNHRPLLVSLGVLAVSMLLVGTGIAVSRHGAPHTSATTDMTTLEPKPPAKIVLGSLPNDLAVSPDGQRLYIAQLSSISVLDTATNAVVATIDAPVMPVGLAVSPDGSILHAITNGALIAIATGTNTEVARVTADDGAELHAIAVSPDGRRGTVSIRDAETYALIITIPVAHTYGFNLAIAVSSDGRTAYVGTGQDITMLDTVTGAVRGSIPCGEPVRALALTLDGRYLHVIGVRNEHIVETRFGKLTRQVAFDASTDPSGVDLTSSRDGSYVFAVVSRNAPSWASDMAVVIDTTTGAVVESIGLPGSLRSIVLSTDGRRLYTAGYLGLSGDDWLMVHDTGKYS
ncbi:DUF4328 domain-containing protein [Nocardia crassostreae]|uniref:DUF4328 domain-containing protein n=1 Tax=Nocardia crassostreae TaxID=53428 RepID=UPI00082F97B4|nr:DUF4328 domain-containing protein [Nocardia crassostreae]